MQSVPVFLVGAPRSGTTWWLRMLSSHPSVAGMCETQLFTNSDQPNPHSAEAIRQQPFWRRLAALRAEEPFGDSARVEWTPGQWQRPLYGSATTDQLNHVADVAARFETYGSWDLAARATFEALDGAAPYLLEKSPINAMRVRRVLEQFPDAHFFGIIRDGRDVMASAQSLDTDWIRAHGRVQFAAPFWAAVCTTLLSLETALPGRVHLVRYEDLVANPAVALRNAWSHLKLETSDQQVAKTVQDNCFESYSGRAQGTAEHGNFFRRGTSGGFREDLRPGDIARFEQLAGKTLVRLGYPLVTSGTLPSDPNAALLARH